MKNGICITVLSLIATFTFACDIYNLDWLTFPTCFSCIERVEAVNFNGDQYIVFWADNTTCADAMTIVYDCCGNEFCLQGGFGGFTQCDDFIEGYSLIDVLWQQNENCCVDPSLIDPGGVCLAVFDPVCGCDGNTYSNSCEAEKYFGITDWTAGECTCDLDNLSWLTLPNCSSCIRSVEVTVFNGETYIIYWGDHALCADALTTVYDCNGDIFCLDGGIAGFAQCDPFFEDYTFVKTLWNQHDECCIDPGQINQNAICPDIAAPVCGCDGVTYINECEAKYYGGVMSWRNGQCEACDVTDLSWLDLPNCDDCIRAVELITYNGSAYVAFWGDHVNCSDALTTVYDCCGNVFCLQNGFAGFTECDDLIDNYTTITTLWQKSIDCCLPYIDLGNQTIYTNLYKAGIEVKAAGIVAPNSQVKFEAGSQIILNSNFSVPLFSEFSAQITGCQNE